MNYLITFLEGIISFISPCMLPLLPVYISYFAGKADKKGHMLLRAVFFVLGFTFTFSLLGLFSGALGALLAEHQRAVNLITGLIVIVFGLSYLDVIKLPFFKGMEGGREISSVFSAFLFGIVYSVSLTPCVGCFPRFRADAGFQLCHGVHRFLASGGLLSGPGPALHHFRSAY